MATTYADLRPEVVAQYKPLQRSMLWRWVAPDGWTYRGTTELSWHCTRVLWNRCHPMIPAPGDPDGTSH
jgi:hypothetical protein